MRRAGVRTTKEHRCVGGATPTAPYPTTRELRACALGVRRAGAVAEDAYATYP